MSGVAALLFPYDPRCFLLYLQDKKCIKIAV